MTARIRSWAAERTHGHRTITFAGSHSGLESEDQGKIGTLFLVLVITRLFVNSC